MTDFGDIWKPVTKGGAYPAHYFRKKHVARSSPFVKDVNDEFTRVASQVCGHRGLHTADKSFQRCIKENMTKFTASGGRRATTRPQRVRAAGRAIAAFAGEQP